MKRPEFGCARCDTRWGGYRTAHCAACHETFASLSAFDAHRQGSHSAGTRHCVTPTSAGLVSAGRAYPCWSAGGDDRWDDAIEVA